MDMEDHLHRIEPPVKEIITTVIAIPFVLVSTWFGISAVNSHFDTVKKEQTQVAERDQYPYRLLNAACDTYITEPGNTPDNTKVTCYNLIKK